MPKYHMDLISKEVTHEVQDILMNEVGSGKKTFFNTLKHRRIKTMETSLLALAADIVTAHASNKEITLDQLMDEIKKVYATLKGIDASETEQEPAVTIEQAFQKDQVVCMICGKAGLITLKRHLTIAHDMKPGQYKKQFNISADQPLAAKDYVEKRRQMAIDRGLGDNLAKARAAKVTKTKKEKK